MKTVAYLSFMAVVSLVCGFLVVGGSRFVSEQWIEHFMKRPVYVGKSEMILIQSPLIPENAVFGSDPECKKILKEDEDARSSNERWVNVPVGSLAVDKDGKPVFFACYKDGHDLDRRPISLDVSKVPGS